MRAKADQLRGEIRLLSAPYAGPLKHTSQSATRQHSVEVYPVGQVMQGVSIQHAKYLSHVCADGWTHRELHFTRTPFLFAYLFESFSIHK